MSKQNSQKSNQRFDKGKWWFNRADNEEKMLYVERTNGRIESKGEQLQEVERVEPSQSKPHILKVRNINVNALAYEVMYLFLD